MKPSDVFVGVIDFFSTLVPGAIATFFLLTASWYQDPDWWPYIERGSPEGWVVFLVSAYVLGHLIAAVGSSLLDPLYDWVYKRWRRASWKSVKTQLGPDASVWAILAARVKKVLQSDPEDGLLRTAKTLKRTQLNELAEAAQLKPDDITNTYWWAGTVVRVNTSAGTAEVDALSAQSKLFRSILVLVLFAAFWVDWSELFAILGWTAVLILSLWRFLRLRWDASERTYEYFIVTSLLGPESGREGPPHNNSQKPSA